MKKMKTIKIVLTIAAIFFVLIQFIQPSRINPPVENGMEIQSHLTVPSEVSSLMKKACYDCHSNDTRWPFYAYIAPASWLVSHDVTEGRKELNFSEWGKYKRSKQGKKLSSIAGEVTSGSMPLPKYIPLHPEANLTDAERKVFSEWARREYEKLMGDEDLE
jgi:hypothetical protein